MGGCSGCEGADFNVFIAMSPGMSSTYEPAGREGDAERAGPAPAVTRRHRKMLAVALAALAVAAIVAVAGSGESGAVRELLEATGDADAAAHNRGVLQQLLVEVERANIVAADRPVELEEKASKGLPGKPCDASCQTRKQEIAARMKALRDQINHDFKAMTSAFPPLAPACVRAPAR